MITRIKADEAVSLLQKVIGGMKVLEKVLPVYESLIRYGQTLDIAVAAYDLPPEESRGSLKRGIPLLHHQKLLIPLEPLVSVWKKVHELSADHFAGMAVKTKKIGEWPIARHQSWVFAMEEYFKTGEIPAPAPEEKEILSFLFIHTWRPFLSKWAYDLASKLEDISWSRRLCPFCGGKPDFGYLAAPHGALHLLCSRCDTDWIYPRGECTHCGNQDSGTYLYYPDDTGKYRLYACRKCMHYFKTLDCRQVTEEPVLMVERIATTPMDAAAIQESYKGN